MKQRAVVRFFALKKPSAKDVKAELEGVHGHEAFSLSAVKKWRNRFANGGINLEDDPRSGRSRERDLCKSGRVFIEESPIMACRRMCQELCIAQTACPSCTNILRSESAISGELRIQ
jgi:transposase